MKKYLVCMLAILVMASCDNKKKTYGNDDADDDTELATDEEEFETKELTYSYDADKVEVNLLIDYPVEGGKALCNAVEEYISEKLGGSYSGDPDDGQKVVDFYGKKILKQLKSELEEQRTQVDSEDYINGFYRNVAIKKLYETDKLVTFSYEESIYLNGAHGMENYYGVTFRKEDGRRFTTDMMRISGDNAEDFNELIKEGLKSYFCEVTSSESLSDDELSENLFLDDTHAISYLPMPDSQPYITKEGVKFTYQPYEISYYAAGAPTFTVPLVDIEPFLKNTAKEMLGL